MRVCGCWGWWGRVSQQVPTCTEWNGKTINGRLECGHWGEDIGVRYGGGVRWRVGRRWCSRCWNNMETPHVRQLLLLTKWGFVLLTLVKCAEGIIESHLADGTPSVKQGLGVLPTLPLPPPDVARENHLHMERVVDVEPDSLGVCQRPSPLTTPSWIFCIRKWSHATLLW